MPQAVSMTKKPPRELHEEGMTERIIIPVTPAMSEEIKTYWHEHRLNSKSEAVRRLIQAGLDAERKKSAKR